ncbi:XrtB/PEP-CTERM-associated polysaccharide biosynthesis outer membrane protein EpsL [Pseudorhodoferax sp.]|uniref:XrtB/PEP-CTERM-associated polysaccharide biosynthesis outer membrane protein EpsL n=1 Tax=Pseudorhodoferax sp. TaxID=1993553 RepID=UPI0039E588C1
MQRIVHWFTACALLLAGSGVAWADDTLTLTAEQRLRTDSNLFRQPTAPPSGPDDAGKSDVISTSILGVELDKRYALQRVELDAQVAAQRYRRFGYLDHDTFNYRAAWHWSLTPRLHGLLGRERKEFLNDFADFRSRTRNMRMEHITRAEGEAELGRDWHLLAALGHVKRTNDQPVEQEGDFALRNTSVGLRRSSPFGSWISYRLRKGHGDYLNRVAADAAPPVSFDELEHELRVSWPMTGKTTLSGRVAHLERRHAGQPARDYGGVVGSIVLNWDITSKLGLQLGADRNIFSYQTAGSSYTVARSLTLTPYWQIGPRTRLQLNYTHSAQDFGGALSADAIDAGRRDTTRSATLALQWRPLHALSLTAGVHQLRRGSNVAAYRYDSHGAELSAKLDF